MTKQNSLELIPNKGQYKPNEDILITIESETRITRAEPVDVEGVRYQVGFV